MGSGNVEKQVDPEASEHTTDPEQQNIGSASSENIVEDVFRDSMGAANQQPGLIRIEKYGIEVQFHPSEILGVDEIQAVPEVPAELVDLLTEDQVIICVGIKASPSDAKFKYPIKVTMPHSAIFTSPETASIGIYHRKNSSDSFSLISAANGDPRCDVRERDLDLYISHFSDWWVVALFKKEFVGKRVICTPFIPKASPMNAEHLLRLCIRDSNYGKPEPEPGYVTPIRGEEYFVAWRSGDLKVTCQVHDRDIDTKTIRETLFHKSVEVNVRFVVKTSSAYRSKVFVRFILEQSEKIEIICPMILSGDEVTPWEHRAQKSTDSPTVTDVHLLRISRELLPSNFSDVYVALGIQASIAQGILAQNDYQQTYMHLLQLWKRRSHRTLRDLDQVLVESEAGGLISMYKQEQRDNTFSTWRVSYTNSTRATTATTSSHDVQDPQPPDSHPSHTERQSYKSTSSSFHQTRPFHDEIDTPITDEELLDIAGNVPSADYHTLDDMDKNQGNNDHLISLKHGHDISFGGLSAPSEILAQGPRAQRAYAEAAKAGKKKVFRTRLMLVGQERVGKTSLKKTLTRQGFDKNEAITDGVETTDTCEISIEVAKAGGKMWSIRKKGHEIEDKKEDEYKKALAVDIAKRLTVIPPQNQERKPHSSCMNPEVAEDNISKRLTVTPHQDQERLEPHNDTALGRGLNPVEAEFVLDNVEPPKAKEKGENMPTQIASLVEKVLKEQVHQKEIGTEGALLSIWDFAGHDIYYSTHQVFLTWRAIYVIVFDLSRSLDSIVPPESRDKNYEKVKGGAKSELTCLEFINFWLHSIYAHAVAPSSAIDKNMSKTAQKSPPIFIVGTHRDSVKGGAEEKKEKIGSAFKKIRKSIMERPFQCHVVPEYYAIENSLEDNDKMLVALRGHIERVAMKEPYMGEEIPLRWLLFEEALAADEINYMSLDQTKELTQSFGIESEHELLTMLTFYHDLGNVIYYGGIEDQQSLLRDIVILNPQWLVDVFKQVITILVPAERDGIVIDAWNTLEKDGILEDRLIEHMWKGFLEKKDALVELMAKFDLICEAPEERLGQRQHDGEDTEVSSEKEKVVKKCYYVPSRLTSHCPPEDIAHIISCTDFYVDFRGFLPDGLFHRLMSRAVRWMSKREEKTVNLFHRHISLMVDKVHHALIEMLPPCEATIKVFVYHGAVDHDGNSYKPPAPSAVKEVMDFITQTLDSLIQHWARRIKYDVRFICPRPKCKSKKLIKDCSKGESLMCGLHHIPKAAIRSKFGMSDEGVESGNKSPISDSSSREMPAHTGPSTSADIPVLDALADGAGSSPKASEHVHLGISEMELHDLAEKLGNHTNLHKFALKLGFRYERWMQFKTSNTRRDGRICSEGTLDMLIDWKNNTLQVSQKALLNEALIFAGFAEFADTSSTWSTEGSIAP